MCSIFSGCWKRDKSDSPQTQVQAQGQNQGQGQIQTVRIEQQFKRDDSTSFSSKDYNLYIVQKNIQQLLDLQKMQMDYLKEIERLHNKKEE